MFRWLDGNRQESDGPRRRDAHAGRRRAGSRSHEELRDAHGAARTLSGNYIHSADRIQNTVEVFSTAEDNQQAVTVRVFQGERPMANDNRLLGQFNLEGIPPAPRGMPQIEVTFDIDANGILHVSAKDKATGKEQSIQIKASSGLSDDEIDKMVQDAEAHAEEDRKFHELIDVRNQADGLIHATNKSLTDLGDKVEESEKKDIESAIEALQEVLKGDDKEAIEAKVAALGELSGKLAERVYKEQAEQGAAEGGAAPEADAGASADDVVDAEFEEVKDTDSK